MSQNPHAHQNHGRDQKRAQFAVTGTPKSRKLVPVIVVGLIGVGAYLIGRNFSDQPAAQTVTAANLNSGPESAGPVESAPSEIAIPLSDVSSGEARFFQYVASNKTPVRFFVIKSSDGVYRAALNACDVCYRDKEGYRQSGDDMVCQKCGRHFPSALVNEVTGGCNPVALTRTVSGDKLLLKSAELESMKTYF